MIGICRPVSGRSTCLPIRCWYRGSSGWTATAVSPSIVSGRVVAMCRTSPVGEPATGYLIVQRWPGDFLVIDLVVGHGRAELGVPVDQPLAAKDLARLEQVEERAADGARADLVEGEPGPLPVARAAHQAELAQDPLLVLVLPGPDSLDQGLAAQVVPGLLLFLEQPLLDDGLGGDAGVVGAGHPEDVVALHPPPADQDVLQRVVERVAQVQRAGDVRRRDHDAVGRPVAGRIGVEIALARPRTRTSGAGRPGDRIAWGGRRSSLFGRSASESLHRRQGDIDDQFAVTTRSRRHLRVPAGSSELPASVTTRSTGDDGRRPDQASSVVGTRIRERSSFRQHAVSCTHGSELRMHVDVARSPPAVFVL